MYLLKRALLFHQGDMETVWRTEHLRHATHRGVIDCLLEWIHIAEHLYPAQFAAVLFAGWVLGHFACYIGKRFWLAHGNPLATFLHFLLHASGHALTGQIDFRQCLCLSHGVCIRRTLYSDMCGTAHIGLTLVAQLYQAVHCLIILHVFRGSLCTITSQLFLECLGGIHALCDGLSHFELKVDKEVQILLLAFLFQTGFLVVLFVDIQEL